MSYIEQMKDWLAENPKATTEEAWKAGYTKYSVAISNVKRVMTIVNNGQ